MMSIDADRGQLRLGALCGRSDVLAAAVLDAGHEVIAVDDLRADNLPGTARRPSTEPRG
jgi:hypothetical protein